MIAEKVGDTDPTQEVVSMTLLAGCLLVTMLLWGFALYPTSAASPDWLVRAKAVCFGTNETGLPDTYGWWVLILAPLSFFLSLVVAFPKELLASSRRVAGSSLGKVALVSVLIAVLLQAGWAGFRIQEGLEIAYADYGSSDIGTLPTNYPVTSKPAPAFTLIDQSGDSVSLESLKGNSIVLTFAFAHCQTVCPAIVHTTRTAMDALPKDKTKLLIITLDPWRDTPGTLPGMATKWNLAGNGHVLSGEVEQVVDVIKSYEVPTERNEKNGDVVHPALIYVLRPDLTIAYTFNNPPRRWLEQAVNNLLAEDSSYG